MKKTVLLLLGLVLLLSLFCLSVNAQASYVQATVSYYDNATEIPTQIYTLKEGSIKIHADVKVLQPQNGDIKLITKAVLNGQTVKTAESAWLPTGQAGVFYLATDIAVENKQCVLETTIVDRAGTVVFQAPVFKYEENVVVPDPGKITEPLSKTVTLTVNGKNVPVRREEMQGMHEGGSRDKDSFYFNVAKVSVDLNTEIALELKGINGTIISDKWMVSPQQKKIPRIVSKGVGYIYLNTPQTLFIRDWATKDGAGYEDLILLIMPLETDVPYKYAPSVTYYADGVLNCPVNPSFSDNQIVYFEEGFHKNVGALQFKPGMRVYLAPGAVLDAKIETYDVSENPNGIKVYGRGVLESRNATNSGFKKGIYFENCNNVVIDGIGCRNAREWQTLYLNCSDFEIRNMNIMAILLNNDGIDLDGVNGFRITDNFIMAADDCFGWHGVDYEKIATKEHPFGRPTFDVYAENNMMYNLEGNAVRFGSSSEQESMYDITIKDTYVVTKTGYAVAITMHDWAKVSDVLIENFYVEESIGTFNGVILAESVQDSTSRLNEGRGLPNGLPSPYGSVENVTIKNLYSPWNGNKPPITVGGCDAEHAVRNLTLENVVVQNGSTIYTGGAGAEKITMQDIKFNPSTVHKDKTFVSEADIIIK